MFPSIKNYTIVREVGSGGMAVVYEAVDTRLQRTVALKVLHPHLCKEHSAADRFIREAKAAAKIDHPNVVRIFDFGAIDDMLYIVMEYVPGTNMERILRVRGALRPTIAMEIMREIADALSQAHNLGIIHRDVKPANILLHKQGRAMLSDFGLAHHLPDPRLTTDDAVAGTPSFMSPEQISGKTLTTASDMYSWGICFYAILTGKLPYRTQKFPEIIEEIRRGAVDLDTVLMASLPPRYHDLLARCLAIDPAKRIRDASELMRQFESMKKERSSEADLRSLCGDIKDEYDAPKTSSGTAIMGMRTIKRFPLMAVLIVLASVAIAGIGIVFYGRISSRSSESDQPVSKSAPPNTTSARSLGRDTVLANRAQEVLAKMEREPASASPEAKQKQVAKLPVRPVQNPALASAPIMGDSSQALLDSFNVLSPEPTGKSAINFNEIAHTFQGMRPSSDKVSTASDSGRLFVYCEPWATVYADDREIGTTPFKGPVSLPAGVHVIKLTNSYSTALIDTVTLQADTVLRKRYRLEPKQ